MGIGTDEYFHILVHLWMPFAYTVKGREEWNVNQSEQQKNVQKILSSREGQQLIKLLSGDGGTALKQAGSALKQGDSQAAQAIMAPLAENPEVQRLLKSLEKTLSNG